MGLGEAAGGLIVDLGYAPREVVTSILENNATRGYRHGGRRT